MLPPERCNCDAVQGWFPLDCEFSLAWAGVGCRPQRTELLGQSCKLSTIVDLFHCDSIIGYPAREVAPSCPQHRAKWG